MSTVKDKRINGRVTEEHYKKLMSILKEKGMTISEWLRLKIERSK